MERADKVDAMTTPEKIGEPSMEEILASIRKIIAEEPQDSAPDRRAVNPLLAGSDRRSDSAAAPLPFSDLPPPSLDRLSNALKPDPVPQREAAAPTRASPLDDDLADILDELPGVLPPAPFGIKLSATTTPAETTEAAPPAPATDLAPAPTSSAPAEPPAPLAPADEPKAADAAPRVSSMPPLRRAAFYPPQRKPDPPSAARPTPAPATNSASELPNVDAAPTWKSSSPPAPAAANGRAAGFAGASSSSPLDTLALGLAAAALSESAMPQSAPSPAPAAAQGQAQPVRSLEDAVTDLLKPMLQQWLADNMPRIIERALRVEAASGVNPGDKPPTQR